MHPLAKSGKTNFKARALLIGERLDLRSLGAIDRLTPADPITVPAGATGIAVLFRYGAAVLFDVAPLEEGELLRQLRPLVQQPYPAHEIETLEIRMDPEMREGMDGGTLCLSNYSLERFQLVADILSKSTVLAMYESRVTRSFDLVEPFAADLERNSQSRRTAKELLKQIGGALLSEHNLVGRVEVVDKPDIIWEHPDLERLYLRLEDEFEIRDRHLVVERKLGLTARTAQTVLELLQNRRSVRMEWYVIILILVEVLLSLYQIFLGK
ncbi:MAG: RMD1 family protein [Thermoguttaceae bacterium]|jgi:uncharacterized Rmd1/YagE family protein